MPTIGMQMPQLYLRGKLVNETIRNLSEDERKIVEQVVIDLTDDPLLQPSRYQFKNALKFTIRGDYASDDATADQEFQIALWRAVVAALHGWGEHGPSEETITDEFQRKKFFQTWVFNYLRQILAENKRSYFKHTSIVAKPTYEAAKEEIIKAYGKIGKVKTDNPGKYCVIAGSLFLLPMVKINDILELKQKYFNKQVMIDISDDQVRVADSGSMGYEMIETSVPTLINVTSTSPSNDDESKAPEIADMKACGFSDPDTIEIMYQNLSDDGQRVMNIIINAPDDYIEMYGEKPVKRYIQEYLKLSPKQVKDAWSELKLNYAATIGTPD